jgi:adenine phosphoribosyltransferase
MQYRARSGIVDVMRSYLRLIDTSTRPRYDITPLFADPTAFRSLVQDLSGYFHSRFEVVAALDALGLILGAAIALHSGTGFVPIRKGGKLPSQADSVGFVDYSNLEKILEIRRGSIIPGVRVLVVDDWIETGAQAEAAIALVEKQGGVVVGVAAINIELNPRTERLVSAYDCHWVWQEAPKS